MDQSSPNFLRPIGDEMLLIRCFFRFSLCPSVLEIFAIKYRKLSKMTPNFGRFSPPQILLGATLQNLYPRYHLCIEPHFLVKRREVTPTTFKVIGTLMQIFKPNF